MWDRGLLGARRDHIRICMHMITYVYVYYVCRNTRLLNHACLDPSDIFQDQSLLKHQCAPFAANLPQIAGGISCQNGSQECDLPRHKPLGIFMNKNSNDSVVHAQFCPLHEILLKFYGLSSSFLTKNPISWRMSQ